MVQPTLLPWLNHLLSTTTTQSTTTDVTTLKSPVSSSSLSPINDLTICTSPESISPITKSHSPMIHPSSSITQNHQNQPFSSSTSHLQSILTPFTSSCSACGSSHSASRNVSDTTASFNNSIHSLLTQPALALRIRESQPSNYLSRNGGPGWRMVMMTILNISILSPSTPWYDGTTQLIYDCSAHHFYHWDLETPELYQLDKFQAEAPSTFLGAGADGEGGLREVSENEIPKVRGNSCSTNEESPVCGADDGQLNGPSSWKCIFDVSLTPPAQSYTNNPNPDVVNLTTLHSSTFSNSENLSTPRNSLLIRELWLINRPLKRGQNSNVKQFDIELPPCPEESLPKLIFQNFLGMRLTTGRKTPGGHSWKVTGTFESGDSGEIEDGSKGILQTKPADQTKTHIQPFHSPAENQRKKDENLKRLPARDVLQQASQKISGELNSKTRNIISAPFMSRRTKSSNISILLKDLRGLVPLSYTSSISRFRQVQDVIRNRLTATPV
ncbi:hypothetical protein PPACK8108_LOCUS8712, partial [Phakopsora pachyrhizi]